MVHVSSFRRKIAKVKIGIASPDRVRSWSSGEVKKPETINHRTFKPERDGLFCERIFGPIKDYECACGKYKGKKYEGTVCEKCGVRVESKEARRRRMGHIELATPVVHVWYLKSSPSILSILLNIPVKILESIIYYGSKRVVEKVWIITEPDEGEEIFYKGAMLYNSEYEIFSKYINFEAKPAIRVVKTKNATVTAPKNGVVDIKVQMLDSGKELTWVIIKAEDGTEMKFPILEGGQVFVEKDQKVEAGDVIADRFMLDEEVLTIDEYELFEEYYPGSIDIERDIERDTPIMIITEISKSVKKTIGKNVGDIVLQEEYEAYKRLMEIGKIPDPQYVDAENPEMPVLEADYGGAAIKKLLEKINLQELKAQLEVELNELEKKYGKKSGSYLKILRRLKLVKDFIKSGNKPEWMVIEALPVIPPDLRPLIQIEGGRFAATDLNDLYRRVINRNNRLRKLYEIDAPEIIIRNEKRILQQAVDSLIYNGRVGKPMTDRGGRPLRSLTDLIKGKKGRFRRNLLGKRVDYSGRAVIVVGPELKIHECGLPKKMALELFKPFVLKKLLEGSNSASKSTRKLKKAIIEKEMPEAWEVLEEVIKGHPVLLNRAPTLHRISIQAFIPKLIEGNAIQLHPLVCPPFNADFDGDQMAVHVPLSPAAQAEAKFLMLSRYNIISPAHGKPLSMPGKDIIAGTYYLTMTKKDYPEWRVPKGIKEYTKPDDYTITKLFADEMEAEYAHEYKKIVERGVFLRDGKLYFTKEKLQIHDPVVLFRKGEKIKTTVGRIIFNEYLPEELRNYDEAYGKSALKKLIYTSFKKYGFDTTSDILDAIKFLGFHYSTLSGLTFSVKDLLISPKKEEIVEETRKKVFQIEELYEKGFLTDEDRYRETVNAWSKAVERVTRVTKEEFNKNRFNPVLIMVDSGARGSIDQLKQLAGMRGLMADPSGRIIEVPITSNFREGLSELEFFISTHGARKGSADTALRTSTAGYLTRRLVDVAQSVTVTISDCGTTKGIEAMELISDDVTVESLSDFLFGRVLAKDVLDPKTENVIVNEKTGKKYERDVMLSDEDAEFLANYKVEIPIYEIRDLKVYEEKKLKVYTEIMQDLNIENREYKKGQQIFEEDLEFLKNNGIETIKVKEYKAENAIFVGENIKVQDENGKEITLALTHEKLDIKTLKLLERYGIEKVLVRPSIYVRSPLTCEAHDGVCAKCYGMDLSNHNIVNVGEAVGIIAAQSIGEPGTQLTMRTFHTGGIATAADITQGLPRAEELFEARKNLKGPEAVFAVHKGVIKGIERKERGKWNIIVETIDGEMVTYEADKKVKPIVEVGDKIIPGMKLTTGNVRPRQVLKSLGVSETAMYLLKEIKKIYVEQGVDIHDKHFEIIIKQMFNKVEVIDGGDTEYMPGDLVNIHKVLQINKQIEEENAKVQENREKVIGKTLAERIFKENPEDKELEILADIGTEVTEELLNQMIEAGIKEIEVFEGEIDLKEDGTLVGPTKIYQIAPKDPIKFERRLLRITKASLERDGWLSAASFQQTVQVLTEAAVEGKVDILKGLKENVIVGQLIPAGTGFDTYGKVEIEILKPKKEEAAEKEAM